MDVCVRLGDIAGVPETKVSEIGHVEGKRKLFVSYDAKVCTSRSMLPTTLRFQKIEMRGPTLVGGGSEHLCSPSHTTLLEKQNSATLPQPVIVAT